jgi:hypothetical protein
LNIFLIFKFQLLKDFKQNDRLSDVYKIYYSKSVVEEENENLKMNGKLKLLNMDGDSVLAENIFTHKMLVFRYTIMNCSDCINAEFELLSKEFINKIDITVNICFLAYYENTRDLVVDFRRFQEKQLNINMFILPINRLQIPIESQNLPYYFTIDSSLIMRDFFIPIKEKPNWTYSYFERLKKNYFK